jgi:hypothetical protein
MVEGNGTFLRCEKDAGTYVQCPVLAHRKQLFKLMQSLSFVHFGPSRLCTHPRDVLPPNRPLTALSETTSANQRMSTRNTDMQSLVCHNLFLQLVEEMRIAVSGEAGIFLPGGVLLCKATTHRPAVHTSGYTLHLQPTASLVHFGGTSLR